jgi:hypothetical protein
VCKVIFYLMMIEYFKGHLLVNSVAEDIFRGECFFPVKALFALGCNLGEGDVLDVFKRFENQVPYLCGKRNPISFCEQLDRAIKGIIKHNVYPLIPGRHLHHLH